MSYNLPPCCDRIVRDCLTFSERGRFMLTARAPAVDLERCMMELYLPHLLALPVLSRQTNERIERLIVTVRQRERQTQH